MAISYSSASYLSQFIQTISSTKMSCLCKDRWNQQASVPRTRLFMIWPRFHTLWRLHPVYQMASLCLSWQWLLTMGGHSSPNNTDEGTNNLVSMLYSLYKVSIIINKKQSNKRLNISLLPFHIFLLKFIFIQFIHFKWVILSGNLRFEILKWTKKQIYQNAAPVIFPHMTG